MFFSFFQRLFKATQLFPEVHTAFMHTYCLVETVVQELIITLLTLGEDLPCLTKPRVVIVNTAVTHTPTARGTARLGFSVDWQRHFKTAVPHEFYWDAHLIWADSRFR